MGTLACHLYFLVTEYRMEGGFRTMGQWKVLIAGGMFLVLVVMELAELENRIRAPRMLQAAGVVSGVKA